MSLNTPKPPTVKSLILLGLRVGGLGSFGLKAIRNRQAASSTLALGSNIFNHLHTSKSCARSLMLEPEKLRKHKIVLKGLPLFSFVLHGRISSSLLQTRNSRKHSRCLQKFPSCRTPVSSGESGRLVTRAQDSLEMPILFQKR
jgi:hypothetical protein